MLTAERLRELLKYDPETGLFTWIAFRGSRAPAGGVAGTKHHSGYLQVKIDGRLYLSHRLAWLYMTGEWPAHQVDHDERDGGDNAWAGLRGASSSQNSANRAVQSNNKLGIKGVNVHRGMFRAGIQVDGKYKHLGYFQTVAEASAAYAVAAKKYFGEFARSA